MTQQSKRRTKSSYVKTCTTLGNQWCMSFKKCMPRMYTFSCSLVTFITITASSLVLRLKC